MVRCILGLSILTVLVMVVVVEVGLVLEGPPPLLPVAAEVAPGTLLERRFKVEVVAVVVAVVVVVSVVLVVVVDVVVVVAPLDEAEEP